MAGQQQDDNMWTIVVFGATGQTGRLTIERLLQQTKHRVTAVARRPEALSGFAPEHAATGRFRVVACDIMTGESDGRLAAALEGATAVVFAAGIASPLQARGGTTLYSAGGGAVLRAMRGRGVNMLVAVTSNGVLHDPGKPLVYRWLVKPLLLDKMYSDMRAFEQEIARASGWLRWSILRPSRLMDGPVGRPAWIGEGLTPSGCLGQVDRADVAALVVACLEGQQRWGRALTISS